MTNDTPDAKESIDTRTRKALEEPLSVVDLDGTPLEDTDVSMVRVISHTGGDYRVDIRDGRCTCPDHEYRNAECKHIRRARLATGRTPIGSDTLVACEVDPNFADHVAADPQVVATDGGVAVEPTADGSANVRPTYIPLGVDDRGASHVYDTDTETVHIVHDDGSRARRVIGDEQTVDEWVEAVADGWGWETRRYGVDAYIDRVAAVAGGADR